MAVLPTQEMVRFGLFELDLKAAQLTKNGTRIRLPQQPLQLLSVLIESPGEIVTREQLRQRLWPSDVFIDFDHGLNKSIQKLRDALGDSADSPRYIETILASVTASSLHTRNGTRSQEPRSRHRDPAASAREPGPSSTSRRRRQSGSAMALIGGGRLDNMRRDRHRGLFLLPRPSGCRKVHAANRFH